MFMSKSKNNFRKQENKERSKYKLWVLFKPGLGVSNLRNSFSYFGYNSDKDGGIARLLKLAERKKTIMKIAILYDNQTEKEIQRFKGA